MVHLNSYILYKLILLLLQNARFKTLLSHFCLHCNKLKASYPTLDFSEVQNYRVILDMPIIQDKAGYVELNGVYFLGGRKPVYMAFPFEDGKSNVPTARAYSYFLALVVAQDKCFNLSRPELIQYLDNYHQVLMDTYAQQTLLTATVLKLYYPTFEEEPDRELSDGEVDEELSVEDTELDGEKDEDDNDTCDLPCTDIPSPQCEDTVPSAKRMKSLFPVLPKCLVCRDVGLFVRPHPVIANAGVCEKCFPINPAGICHFYP